MPRRYNDDPDDPLQAVATPRGRGQSPPPLAPPPDLFADLLERILDEEGSVAAERTWERFARAVVKHWRLFNANQSPLSTWSMVAKSTETILKIRLAAKKTGSDHEQAALEEFETMMAELFRPDDDLARQEEHPERGAETLLDDEDDEEED